jgi:uncharacterized protein YegJ (DUF2314 family)
MESIYPYYVILGVLTAISIAAVAAVFILSRRPAQNAGDRLGEAEAQSAAASLLAMARRRSGESPVRGADDVDVAASRDHSAASEAQRRWEEFVDAFCCRESGGHFSIKGPIGSADNVELIWLKVTAIENNIVFCQLEVEPTRVKTRHAGARVRVRVADVCDWLYKSRGHVEGGFTIQLMNEALRRERNDR